MNRSIPSLAWFGRLKYLLSPAIEDEEFILNDITVEQRPEDVILSIVVGREGVRDITAYQALLSGQKNAIRTYTTILIGDLQDV